VHSAFVCDINLLVWKMEDRVGPLVRTNVIMSVDFVNDGEGPSKAGSDRLLSAVPLKRPNLYTG
jgi:hypothetical protein